MREYNACRTSVFNRGKLSVLFLDEMVDWALNAPDDIFSPNQNFDIYNKVRNELGPYTSLLHRKAVMLEVMRVLALFESGGNWLEGVDTSRRGPDTSENAEAGAWQISYDARNLAPELKRMIVAKGIPNGIVFQQAMKFDHRFAMEFVARLLRIDIKNPSRIHNGPLYKGAERIAIRPNLREAKHSIYPWLNRAAVEEFSKFLST